MSALSEAIKAEAEVRQRIAADIESNADLIAEYAADKECAVHLVAMLVGLARGDQP
jgi:hypothetical protein